MLWRNVRCTQKRAAAQIQPRAERETERRTQRRGTKPSNQHSETRAGVFRWAAHLNQSVETRQQSSTQKRDHTTARQAGGRFRARGCPGHPEAERQGGQCFTECSQINKQKQVTNNKKTANENGTKAETRSSLTRLSVQPNNQTKARSQQQINNTRKRNGTFQLTRLSMVRMARNSRSYMGAKYRRSVTPGSSSSGWSYLES
jgi:hypothetical protein